MDTCVTAQGSRRGRWRVWTRGLAQAGYVDLLREPSSTRAPERDVLAVLDLGARQVAAGVAFEAGQITEISGEIVRLVPLSRRRMRYLVGTRALLVVTV